MKSYAKKWRLFLIIMLCILFLAPTLYIASKRYTFYRNSLDYSISRSYGDLISSSQTCRKLAQTILKDNKIEKYEALLFDKQFEDIIISLDEFADMASTIDKKNNYRTILNVVSYSPYGSNFAVFKGTDKRQLNNNDKAFLNRIISIDNIILNASPISTPDKSRVPYIKNDTWFSWFKQIYNSIMQESPQFLKLYDAKLSLTVSDEDSKPLADVRIIIINENGDVIGILTSDKNGHAEKKLTVPVDRRYYFAASRGTVTAIAYKKGYSDTILFEVPVSDDAENQVLHMKASSRKSTAELADNSPYTASFVKYVQLLPSTYASNKSDITTGRITFIASDSNSKLISGVTILLIGNDGSLIDTLKTKNNGTVFKELTVPTDKRYSWKSILKVEPRGTITAIAFKKNYRSAVIFEIPVNSNSVQPFFMNINSSNTDNPDSVLGMNLDNDLNSLVAKYMSYSEK